MAIPKRTVIARNKRSTRPVTAVTNVRPPQAKTSVWILIAKSLVTLGVFLVPLAIGTWTPDHWEIHKSLILLATVVLGWLCMSIGHLRQPALAWRWHPLDWIVLVLGLSVTVSTATSLNSWTSLAGLQGSYAETLPVTLAFVGLYFISVRLFRTSADRLLVWSSLIGGIGFALLAQLFQFSRVSLLPGSLHDNQLISTLANSTTQIGILAAAVATTALLLWSRAKESWAKLALAGVVTIGWLVMFILGQATAWAVFAWGMMLVVVIQSSLAPSTGMKMVFMAVILAAAGMFGQFLNISSHADIPPTKDISLSQSTSIGTAFTALSKRPVLGTGPNTWYDAFVRYRPLSYNNELTWSSRYIRSGSEWTQLLATQGVVGLGLWFGLLAIAGWEFWRSLKHGYSFTLLASLFAVGALGLAMFLITWSLTLLVFGWTAIGLGRAKIASRDPETAPGRGSVPALSFAAAAILLLVIGYPIFRLYGSEMLLAKAQLTISPENPRAVITTIDRALSWNSRNGEAAVLLANAEGVAVTIDVMQNNIPAAQQDLTQATTTMRAAVKRDPNNPAIYEAENNLLNSLSQYLQAPEQQANLNAAFLRTLEPASPIHDVVYGQTLMIIRARLSGSQTGSTPANTNDVYLAKALAAYDQALLEKPDYLQARFSRAEANFEGAQYTAALADLETLTATYPNLASYWILKGQTLAKLEKLDTAKDAFEQALVLEPRTSMNYIFYSRVYKDAKNPTKQREVLDRGLKALPNDAQLEAELKTLSTT